MQSSKHRPAQTAVCLSTSQVSDHKIREIEEPFFRGSTTGQCLFQDGTGLNSHLPIYFILLVKFQPVFEKDSLGFHFIRQLSGHVGNIPPAKAQNYACRHPRNPTIHFQPAIRDKRHNHSLFSNQAPVLFFRKYSHMVGFPEKASLNCSSKTSFSFSDRFAFLFVKACHAG